jgi:hypothetical protein
MEDLQSASKLLAKALEIRERYMRMSQQEFPSSVHEFLYRDRGNKIKEEGLYRHLKRATLEGKNHLKHFILLQKNKQEETRLKRKVSIDISSGQLWKVKRKL